MNGSDAAAERAQNDRVVPLPVPPPEVVEALEWFDSDPEAGDLPMSATDQKSAASIVRWVLSFSNGHSDTPEAGTGEQAETPADMRGARSVEDVISVLRRWAAACRSHSYVDGPFMQGLRTGNLAAADGYEEAATALSAVPRADRSPRTWSMPAPPPDDVTVVHVGEQEFTRDLRRDLRWRNSFDGEAWLWEDLLSEGTVVEGEPPAPEPQPDRWEQDRGAYSVNSAPEPQADPPVFAVGDRVLVKAFDMCGVVVEVDDVGAPYAVRSDDEESDFLGWRLADELEPAPERASAVSEPQAAEPPRFERGFYRLARTLRVQSFEVQPDREVAVHSVTGDEVTVSSATGAHGVVSTAALAAAGAERVEER